MRQSTRSVTELLQNVRFSLEMFKHCFSAQSVLRWIQVQYLPSPELGISPFHPLLYHSGATARVGDSNYCQWISNVTFDTRISICISNVRKSDIRIQI